MVVFIKKRLSSRCLGVFRSIRARVFSDRKGLLGGGSDDGSGFWEGGGSGRGCD